MDDFSPITLPEGRIQNLGYMANNYNLPKAIMNFFDWQNLFRDGRSFAAINAFGQVSATEPKSPDGNGNYAFYFNKPTGFLTKYELDSSFVLTVASPYCNLAADLTGEITGKDAVHPTFTLNQVTSTPASLSNADATAVNVEKALDLLNIHIREGLGFYVVGGLYDSSNTALTGHTCGFAFVGTDSGKLVCELMDSSVPTDKTSASPVYLGKIAGPCTVYVTDYAKFDGAAPAADDMGTKQYFNTLQMFDATIGKGFSEQSQSTYFDNKFQGLFPPLETMEHQKYDMTFLFGMKGAVPTDIGGSARARGATKGIWGLMNLHDASLNTDRAKPGIRVDEGTAIDFWKLYEFIDQRPTYTNKEMLCLLSPRMYMLLMQAAEQTRDLVRVERVAFPAVPSGLTKLTIGETTLTLVTDTHLEHHPQFKDYSGKVATTGDVMLCLDTRYAGIKYQKNERLGLMIPQISNIDPINAERVDRAHMFSCWGTAIWNPHMHCFYGLKEA